MSVQALTIAGEKFVLIPAEEYKRLITRDRPTSSRRIRKRVYPASAAIRAVLGRKIVAARRKAGWTQSDLAKRAGIRLQTLARIEKAEGSADLATVGKIDRALREVGV